MFDNVKVGKGLSALRKARGLTQEEVASRLNISPQAVSKWENGHAMPELSLLVELAEVLDSTPDGILFPDSRPGANANFEHILLPYAPIGDFSGKTWPRSMAYPAVLAAIKLFMGLEEHRDSMGRQINDDTEYILQSAFSCLCFGYSWGPDDALEACLPTYGLTGEVYNRKDHSEEEFVHLAVKNILNGYPVLVIPREYSDIILATGFSSQGKVLKGLPFLDGDDDKNSVMSFQQQKNFAQWYVKDCRMLLVRPGGQAVPIAARCREALQRGASLVRNLVHVSDQPLEGHGLVIYDNWCEELKKETAQNLETLACLFPHIFIHYEGKLRIKQFLALCTGWLDDVDERPIQTAISKYEEIISMCEKCLHLPSETPKNIEEAKTQRRMVIGILQRSKELEAEAWEGISSAIL